MTGIGETNDDCREFFVDPEIPVFTTGVVCRLLGVPVWVLKQLDNEGIVCPPRKNEGQSRLYSHKDLQKVHRCWFYIKVHKVKIPGLKIILRMESQIDR